VALRVTTLTLHRDKKLTFSERKLDFLINNYNNSKPTHKMLKMSMKNYKATKSLSKMQWEVIIKILGVLLLILDN
jgi:hypothetical protein